jgi:hypothetical protein
MSHMPPEAQGRRRRCLLVGAKRTSRDVCYLSAFEGKLENICSLIAFSTATTTCIVYPPLMALRMHWGISPTV